MLLCVFLLLKNIRFFFSEKELMSRVVVLFYIENFKIHFHFLRIRCGKQTRHTVQYRYSVHCTRIHGCSTLLSLLFTKKELQNSTEMKQKTAYLHQICKIPVPPLLYLISIAQLRFATFYC